MNLVMTRNGENGFTLIELLVTLVVAAVLASIAVPSFQNMIEENRLTSQTNSLVSAFKLARSEAVRRAVPVTLVANDGDFANGWCVYEGGVDDACNNNTEIRQFSASGQVQWVGGGDTSFEFNDRGRRTQPDPASGDVDVMVRPPDCQSGDNRQRTVSVSNAGRTSASRGECP